MQKHFLTIHFIALTPISSPVHPFLLVSSPGSAFVFYVLAESHFSFTSHLHLLMCQWPWCHTSHRGILKMKGCIHITTSVSALFHACHCSALSATLPCFVNNHLFVAGIVATITSDLPVSSIMNRLLDVNICKSLLLNLPPGWD